MIRFLIGFAAGVIVVLLAVFCYVRFGFVDPRADQEVGALERTIAMPDVADVIRRRLTGCAQPKPFWYWDKGELAIVGRAYAVADLRLAQFTGFPAWWVWAGVHIYFLSLLEAALRWTCPQGNCMSRLI
jgi:hypothetical protein